MVLRKKSGKDVENARLRQDRENFVNKKECRAARRVFIQSIALAAVAGWGNNIGPWVSDLWNFAARMVRLFGSAP